MNVENKDHYLFIDGREMKTNSLKMDYKFGVKF